MMPKINQNIIIGISIAVVLLFGVIILVALLPKEKPLSEEETMEEVLERLTPAEPEPLTEEERREQEELLKELTPDQPKPMTEEEQKELEELLKQLTPQ